MNQKIEIERLRFLKKQLEIKIESLLSSSVTTAYVEQQSANAETSAKSYADGKFFTLTDHGVFSGSAAEAINAARAAAIIAAATDATTKANNARDAAIADAITKYYTISSNDAFSGSLADSISGARAAAIAAAASDATTKANTAKTEAINDAVGKYYTISSNNAFSGALADSINSARAAAIAAAALDAAAKKAEAISDSATNASNLYKTINDYDSGITSLRQSISGTFLSQSAVDKRVQDFDFSTTTNTSLTTLLGNKANTSALTSYKTITSFNADIANYYTKTQSDSNYTTKNYVDSTFVFGGGVIENTNMNIVYASARGAGSIYTSPSKTVNYAALELLNKKILGTNFYPTIGLKYPSGASFGGVSDGTFNIGGGGFNISPG
jgi:hypothetical protein